MIKNLVKWQTISSVTVFSLALLQLVVLARLLELSDFGLIAIVMVVINISQVLSELGIANYLVYKQKISEKLNSTVFWLCFLSGIIFFIVLFFISPLVAKLYGEPKISFLLIVAALIFIPISFSSQLQSRYICEFKLNSIAKFEILSKGIGTIFAISSAYTGMGAVSILLGAFVTNLIKCILIWIYADKMWRPKFQFSIKDARNAYKYGIYQIGSQLINQFRANLDILLLGTYIDSAQLGAYSLAKQLIQKPATFVLPIVRKISLPLLASLQSNMEKVRNTVKKAHTYVAVLLSLPYILLCFLNDELVIVIYGIDKLEASLFIVPLSLFWLFRSIGGALAGTLTQAMGKTNIDFYWNLSVVGLFSLLCFILVPYGPYVLAWGFAILQAVLMSLVFIVFYKRIINLSYQCYISPIILFSILSVCSVYISVFLLNYFIGDMSNLLYVVLVTVLSTILYYIGCSQISRYVIKLPKLLF